MYRQLSWGALARSLTSGITMGSPAINIETRQMPCGVQSCASEVEMLLSGS